MFIRRKSQSELITGLDIGSTAIRVAVANQVTGGGKFDLQLVGLIEVPAEGVHRGVITSIEETVSSISHALEQTERLIGVPIEHAWVGISGSHVVAQESKGVVAVAKSDGEIAGDDVARAVEAAGAIAPPLNYEVLHVLPRTFTVDGQTGIKDPVGMTGVRLEVDTQIIHGSTSHIKNLTKAVYRTGIDIDDLILSVLAVGDAVVTPRQKELGVGVVNIGGSTTSVLVYEEGDILHAAVLPIGSEHVTSDLAIGLKSSIEVAEYVKRDFGACVAGDISKKERMDLVNAGGEMNEDVSLKHIAEIIQARMEEILEKVEQEFIKAGRSQLLPAGVVFTGGGAKVARLIELAKYKLGLPASLGYPFDVRSASEKVNDLSFATAIGLAKWGAKIRQGKTPMGMSSQKGVEKISRRGEEWVKALVP